MLEASENFVIISKIYKNKDNSRNMMRGTSSTIGSMQRNNVGAAASGISRPAGAKSGTTNSRITGGSTRVGGTTLSTNKTSVNRTTGKTG